LRMCRCSLIIFGIDFHLEYITLRMVAARYS
jgi:hypothetical protein